MREFFSVYFVNFFDAIHGMIQSVISNPNYSYGIAIIIFTIVVKVILLPLTIKQTRSSVKLAEVQPKTAAIQEKYKNDPQRAQQEILKLYKEENVSPMSGCLPLLIQYPIIIVLFYAFSTLNYHGAGFLWIPNLNQPDPYFILPVLSGVSTYIMSKMLQPKTNANSSSQAMPNMGMMNIVMAGMFTWMGFKMQSAIVIYWIINNLIQLIQTLLLRPRKKNEELATVGVTNTDNKGKKKNK
ncbi:membrane protein insertase YidC [Clostridium senegalense]|uniref:membrane protein insertase YidC n=1 Tax=Clostridium senegalense TaxID=1465809 RepID=UPI0002885E49|nr:membrane protein insertase YidC [Clostridium senegalense]